MIPSASNLAIILLATLFPVMVKSGMSSLTAAGIIATTATVMPTPLGSDNVDVYKRQEVRLTTSMGLLFTDPATIMTTADTGETARSRLPASPIGMLTARTLIPAAAASGTIRGTMAKKRAVPLPLSSTISAVDVYKRQELEGSMTKGCTLVDLKGYLGKPANAKVCMDIDQEMFRAWFLESIGRCI